ncbi:unnamed protein product [Leptidea sinapis]|uniref:Uncharacterized protein n=1 Tax=Leptidea sinapis TaxID=189913 RepID=A0A5E4QGB2_9NEOP|nr:unnamed protein product [Leptidea sinapis]
MIMFSNNRQLDHNEIEFKRRALRDAVMCIGWIKLTSIICYMTLYSFVNVYSTGDGSMTIKIMILITIPLYIANGEKLWALDVSLGLCLICAIYNSVLGSFGGLHFIRFGHDIVHFVLASIFGLMTISSCTIICYDIVLVVIYKRFLQSTSHDNV